MPITAVCVVLWSPQDNGGVAFHVATAGNISALAAAKRVGAFLGGGAGGDTYSAGGGGRRMDQLPLLKVFIEGLLQDRAALIP